MTTPDSGRLRTVAVVLAGGTGARVGLDIPKQLLKIAGRTIIEHTVDALHSCDVVDEIMIVMAADHVGEAERLFSHNRDYPKLTRVLSGGSDRSASTRAALEALGDEECNVLFHDAVRPLLAERVITDCVVALRDYEAVDVAIASADTIVAVDAHNQIVEIPDRSRLRRGQTPQAFRLSTIRRAYELAAQDVDFRTTDDCGVVRRYLPDVPILVVPGDETNMKVTYPIDLFLADKLFQLASRFVSHPDERALGDALREKVVVIFGGSYGIGKDVAALAAELGSQVYSFSRSSTNTYIEDPADVAAALTDVAGRTGGRIDAVVLSAAQLAKGPLVDVSLEDLQQQVQVNFVAPLVVARAAEPYLRAARGHLVFFTSSSYTRGRAGYAVYSSAKAAVVNLAQALADEWSANGVRVNVINPERTRTPMRERAFGPEPEDSLLDSEVVARTVLDVLASNMTGHVIDVRRHQADGAVGEPQQVSEAVAEVEARANEQESGGSM